MVMALRIYGLYGQSVPIVGVLGALAVLDFVVQLVADGFVQRECSRFRFNQSWYDVSVEVLTTD
jgi:hypothetical protein